MIPAAYAQWILTASVLGLTKYPRTLMETVSAPLPKLQSTEKQKTRPRQIPMEIYLIIITIDKTAFKEGDAIVKDGSSERFIISTSASLEGVYCINQGYAVFRQVEILDQNEEYAIVSSQTSYGLSRYDRIVRKASQVNEQDILY
mgnify:CR=1 FL=1